MKNTIIHTISSYDVFGPEKTTINECLELKRTGQDAIIVVIRPKGRFPFMDKVKSLGIRCVHLESGLKFDLRAVFKLHNIIKREGCILVHSHGYKADVISLLACRIAKVPIVTTVHGWTSEDAKVRMYERIQAFSWCFFDRVICVSEYYKNRAIEFGVSKNKAVVIYNGILTGGADSIDGKALVDLRRACNISTGDYSIGIIGRLSIEKGHATFLKAAAEVLNNSLAARFFIVGEGPERDSIKQLVGELDIRDRVSMLGHIDDMEKIYPLLDMIVISSLREGLPNVLLEAALHKKVVVAAKIGGIPEVIRDGKDGVLVSSEDAEGFARAILDIMNNRSKAMSMAVSARDRVINEFNFDIRMRKIKGLYKEIMRTGENA